MKKEFRIQLLKKLSDHKIRFAKIQEVANEGKHKKDRLSYQVVYNVLNDRQEDKNQRVLNAALKAIEQAKTSDEINDIILNN